MKLVKPRNYRRVRVDAASTSTAWGQEHRNGSPSRSRSHANFNITSTAGATVVAGAAIIVVGITDARSLARRFDEIPRFVARHSGTIALGNDENDNYTCSFLGETSFFTLWFMGKGLVHQ